MHTAELVLALVALATAVAALAERLSLPAPSLLVLAGLGVALLPGVPAVAVPPDAIAVLVLPPLLQAAAVELAGADLRAVARPLGLLTVGLVLATAASVALAVRLVAPGLGSGTGLVLGAALASTDPVAVSALARRLALPPRVQALVLGESLLNDATSLLLLRLVVAAVAAGAAPGPGAVAGRLLVLAAGGAAVGATVALATAALRRRSQDPVTASVLALLTPYACYVAAERLDASGVTAVVVGGLLGGRRRYAATTGPGRLQVSALYGAVVFVLESGVFAVIGLELPTLVRGLPEGVATAALVGAVALGALLVTRFVGVGAATALLQSRREGGRARTAAVVTWAGTRGVVPLAAALSLPLTVEDGRPFPHRGLLLVATAGTTAATLVLQGLTLAPLVRRTGVVEDRAVLRREEALARHEALQAATRRLEEAASGDGARAAAAMALRREYADRQDRAARVLADLDAGAGADATARRPRDAPAPVVRALRRELALAQSQRLAELVRERRIGESARASVQRRVDLDEARTTG